MDMIGRLNPERKLSIGGVGTSPILEAEIDAIKKPTFDIKKEYSGMAPSDHASFYNAGIPVLGFFTGQHQDYHKPTDDHQLINYAGLKDVVSYIFNLVTALDKKPKLVYTKTKDETQNRMSFSVTMGVMPDYLYDGKGMKIDGTKEGKPAALAGLEKGDILIKMNEYEITDIQAYMKCLSIFKAGQTVDAVILRAGKEITKKVTF
jgi:C-terminal processing protease CtpA/Prc